MQFGVLLGIGIIAGGALAYMAGTGIKAGAVAKSDGVGFVEELDRLAPGERDVLAKALPGPVIVPEFLATPDTLAVQSRLAAPAKAKIAIIIDDIGLNRRAFDRLVLLPEPLTLSILPWSPDAQTYADLARRAGHEVMLHLPMAPAGMDRPDSAGPDTLRLGDTPADLAEKLARNLDAFDGYVGVNNHMGSGLTTDAMRMGIVLTRLRERGVFFLDSVTTSQTAVPVAARRNGLDYLHRDVFLDSDYEEVTEESVAVQLAEVERIALATGEAVAIGHPYGSTIAALTRWIEAVEADGRFELVAISTLTEPTGTEPTLTAEDSGRPPAMLVQLR